MGRDRLRGGHGAPLAVPGDISAWFVLAGSRRERPSRGAFEVVSDDELWVAVPGEWWVLCGYLDEARSLNGFKIHATAPFEAPLTDTEIAWVDLDLDFDVTVTRSGSETNPSSTTTPARWAIQTTS